MDFNDTFQMKIHPTPIKIPLDGSVYGCRMFKYQR